MRPYGDEINMNSCTELGFNLKIFSSEQTRTVSKPVPKISFVSIILKQWVILKISHVGEYAGHIVWLCTNFAENLHENEKSWSQMRGARQAPPSRFANARLLQGKLVPGHKISNSA